MPKDPDTNDPASLAAGAAHALRTADDDPPVVARMVIEIRSDGTRTVARGALEDAVSGERVALEARGGTPLALARSLMKSMLSAPLLARHAVRALLAGRKSR